MALRNLAALVTQQLHRSRDTDCQTQYCAVVMAFEVFDDVAFFWFGITLLMIVLLPWTCVWIGGIALRRLRAASCPIKHDASAGRDCGCDACHTKYLQRVAAQQSEKPLLQRWSFWSNVLYFGLCVFFVVMLLQVPEMQGQKMATFDPFEVLELDKSVSPTLADIKRAYRSLSLIHHPDKHPGDKEAEERFVLISKAHQVLTDPSTRENWEKYGNPDGYQGTSVTIGLPSFLTNGKNELLILIAYFVAFFIILPVAVGIWWSKASQIHESGVRLDTVGLWTQLVSPEMTTKFLVQFIGAAPEYRSLETVHDPQEMYKLVREIERSDRVCKSKFNIPYMVHARELLHAHMLRMPIPSSLQIDLKSVLKESVHLMDTFIDCMSANQRSKPTFGAILLQQLICQAMWMHDDPLLQLPHFDDNFVKQLEKKRVKGLQKFLRLTPSARGEILSELFQSPAVVQEIEHACQCLPSIELVVSTSIPGADQDSIFVEDRDVIREGDVVQLSVKLHRLLPEEIEGSEEIKLNSKERRQAAKQRSQNATDSEAAVSSDSSDNSSDSKSIWCCSRRQSADPNSLDSILQAQSKSPSKIQSSIRQAFTPRFPFPKTERWLVAIVAWRSEVDEEDKQEKQVEHILMLRRTAMTEAETETEITVMIPAAHAGVAKFEVRVFADSYVGLDPEPCEVTIKTEKALTDDDWKERRRKQYYLLHPEEEARDLAKKSRKEGKQALKQATAGAESKVVDNSYDSQSAVDGALVGSVDESEDSDDDIDTRIDRQQYMDDEEDVAQEEAPIHWYYLWNSNLLEAIITLILLWLVGFLLIDIADKKGWWDPYCQPILDRVHIILSPYFAKGSLIRTFLGNLYRFFSLGKRDLGIIPVSPIN